MRAVASAVCALVLGAVVSQAVSAQTINVNVLQRVYAIRYGGEQGTAFTLDYEGRQYLVTARHILKSARSVDTVEIRRDLTWAKLEVTVLFPENPSIDVAVLAAGVQLSPTWELPASIDGIIIGQDAYFLGFPYMMGSEGASANRGFPIPFVKKAVISAMSQIDGAYRVIYCDGHNNPGFSGGPLVFWNSKAKKFNVAGVVIGYRNSLDSVFRVDSVQRKGERTDLVTLGNSGIVVVYEISSVVEVIKKNPVGCALGK